MKKMLVLATLLIGSIQASASPARTMIEGQAQMIRETYNDLKHHVGVGYDITAAPQLACMGKLFISWVNNYNSTITPNEAELSGSLAVSDMRTLASDVENDNATYESFILGLTSIVGQAMEQHQLAPPALTLENAQKGDYITKLNACRSAEFIDTVNKIALESNVDLNPQTLEDENMIQFLEVIQSRK